MSVSFSCLHALGPVLVDLRARRWFYISMFNWYVLHSWKYSDEPDGARKAACLSFFLLSCSLRLNRYFCVCEAPVAFSNSRVRIQFPEFRVSFLVHLPTHLLLTYRMCHVEICQASENGRDNVQLLLLPNREYTAQQSSCGNCLG